MGSRNRFGKPDPIKPSRVTHNMAEFVTTRGKLTEDEKRRQGRKTPSGRKATPRTIWGDKRPVTKSTGGKDSARRTRIERVKRYNKRMWGGVNPKVTSAGERTKINRRAKWPKDPITGQPGGQKYKPITRGDKRASDYQSRQNRIKRRYSAGTEGSRKLTTDADRAGFKTGKPPKVTTGQGRKTHSGYMTHKVRGVDNRPGEKVQRKSGEGLTRTQGANAADPKRTGPNRITGGTRGGRLLSGSDKSSKGGKGGFNVKSQKESKNFWSGETPKVRKARIEKLHNAMRQGKAWGKYMNPRAKSLIKAGASLAGGGKGRLAKALLRELGFASLEKLKATLDSRRAKRPVANLPSGYKESEKKAFKQTKKWNKVNRKKL